MPYANAAYACSPADTLEVILKRLNHRVRYVLVGQFSSFARPLRPVVSPFHEARIVRVKLGVRECERLSVGPAARHRFGQKTPIEHVDRRSVG